MVGVGGRPEAGRNCSFGSIVSTDSLSLDLRINGRIGSEVNRVPLR